MDKKISYDAILKSIEAADDEAYQVGDEEILCRTEEKANVIADFLEVITGYGFATSYYDPKEDAEEEEINDEYTGWWSIHLA